MISTDWIRIDTDSGSGNTRVQATILKLNTSRIDRSVSLIGTTSHNATAEAVFSQDSIKGEFIDLDHFENEKGVTVEELHSGSATYYLVGYSNSALLGGDEPTHGDKYTDIDDNNGLLMTDGYELIEDNGNGASHSGIAADAFINPDYGAEASFEFRMPFVVEANVTSEDRLIMLRVENDGGDAYDVISIYQNASII